MKKIVFILALFLVGCEQIEVIDQSVQNNENKNSSINNIQYQNMFAEDRVLLAIKYNIEEKKLLDMIVEYEKLTKSFSLTGVFNDFVSELNESESTNEKLEVISIKEAIEIISTKHQIPKEKLAAMIIEIKLLSFDDVIDDAIAGIGYQ